MIVGTAGLFFGLIVEFSLAADPTHTLAHEMGYVFFAVCYSYFLIVASKKRRGTFAHRDDRALDFHQRYTEDYEHLNYFSVGESNHTTVNMWRKMRGKLTVYLFKGNEPGYNQSCTTYVVTKKQLFEMRLRGYGENAPIDFVRKALTDKWMINLRAWIN